MSLVREAGGFATNAAGGGFSLEQPGGVDVVAASPVLHPKLLEVVAEGVAASQGLAGDGSLTRLP